jgi:hypothetical protein
MKPLVSGMNSPRRMALEGNRIWFTTADAVMRCDLPDCKNLIAIGKNLKSPWGVAVDETWAFVVLEGSQGMGSFDGQVIRLPK